MSAGKGKIYLVGLGTGNRLDLTPRAVKALEESDSIAGYHKYIEYIEDITRNKSVIASGMKKEIDRCKAAVEEALKGKVVSVVSSGDAGVYGMGGLVLEIISAENLDLDVEFIPGITAATAAAARVGAPFMLDFAVISLSDLLQDWDVILKRLEAAASADFAVALYNPKSMKRVTQIEDAAAIFRKYRPGTTPVAICTSVGREDEKIVISDLDNFLNEEINMFSIVLIGNSTSVTDKGWIITPRGYRV